MIYLFAFLALTLNPYIWKENKKKRSFLVTQVVRLALGFLVIFVVSYIGLVDHSFTAFISYGMFLIGIFLLGDFVYLKTNRSLITILGGCFLLLASIYMAFIYPLTIVDDQYEFVKKKVTTVAKDKISMDEKHIPVVPESYARYRSEKLLGELKHSSYYDLGDSTIQKIKGNLYWVTPIEYTGFFKWRKADAAPGFIKMNAEDENADAELVNKEMNYVPSAFFSEDLNRHVRSIHKGAILLSPSFEPDDQDQPFYVIPYGYYNKFRHVVDIKGIYLVDSKSGKVKEYGMNQIPKFIDHVIPTEVAEDWNEWYGKYVHGFWNAHFSQEDIKVPTDWEGIDEVNGVFNNKLELNWFTDFTRPKSGSGSMVGYTMMNGRTGKITYYREANGLLNGKSAMNVAEKTFRANKYVAATPNLYMIYNQFTWVVPLLDSNHVIRELMLINARDEKVYSADTAKRTLFDNYKYAISTKIGNDGAVPTNIADMKSISGKVTDVYKSETDHGTSTKFMITGSEKIFVVSSIDFPYSIFLEKGKTVEMKFIDTEEIISSVNDFKMKP